jgi:hypothetical protein
MKKIAAGFPGVFVISCRAARTVFRHTPLPCYPGLNRSLHSTCAEARARRDVARSPPEGLCSGRL